MSWQASGIVAGLLIAALTGPAQDVTKEAKLKETLEVKELQGGFAGFTGQRWVVEPSGDWSILRVGPRDREERIANGKLTAEQLANLVKELNKYEVAKLSSPKSPRPMANPKIVMIKLGKCEAVLQLQGGAELPEPDTKTIEGRFAGIYQAVTKALKPMN